MYDSQVHLQALTRRMYLECNNNWFDRHVRKISEAALKHQAGVEGEAKEIKGEYKHFIVINLCLFLGVVQR